MRTRDALIMRAVFPILFLATSLGVAFGQQPQTSSSQKPAKHMTVAFVVSERFNMIDFAGPWEVFGDAAIVPKGKRWEEGERLFTRYTVSDSTQPLKSDGSGGAMLVPAYAFADAPKPDIVVIGAQSSNSPALLSWLRKANAEGSTIMSVCIGAGKLARAGLLDNLPATTHHEHLESYREGFPKTQWLTNRRYVRSTEIIYTAGGLTSGIDLALHLVAKYFGDSVAQGTADYMEYRSDGWKDKE
jgi:transcriptional regulator GlxA family with amidase domain